MHLPKNASGDWPGFPPHLRCPGAHYAVGSAFESATFCGHAERVRDRAP